MSTEEQDQAAGLSRKEKRALRDAERAEKSKKGEKRKIDEASETAADEDGAYAPELEADFIALPKVDEKEVKPIKAGTVSKKRKQSQPKPSAPAPAADGETPAQPASKKRRKTTKPQDGENGGDEATKPANQRFIVFVGNLPYATTDASLKTHFASLQPFTLRHRTDPKTKKSKGFAFLEFENFDRMKTCLKLYHHSYFDPEDAGKSKLASQDGEEELLDQGFRARGRSGKAKEKGRRINVELTAGGGGGGGERMEKIRVKNVRLEEQRQRRKEAEKKEKLRKEKKEGGGKSADRGEKGAEREGAAAAGAGANEGMHPSRLAMMGRR